MSSEKPLSADSNANDDGQKKKKGEREGKSTEEKSEHKNHFVHTHREIC